jgi:hypothetical protein
MGGGSLSKNYCRFRDALQLCYAYRAAQASPITTAATSLSLCPLLSVTTAAAAAWLPKQTAAAAASAGGLCGTGGDQHSVQRCGGGLGCGARGDGDQHGRYAVDPAGRCRSRRADHDHDLRLRLPKELQVRRAACPVAASDSTEHIDPRSRCWARSEHLSPTVRMVPVARQVCPAAFSLLGFSPAAPRSLHARLPM